jgi:hypothetical protein
VSRKNKHGRARERVALLQHYKRIAVVGVDAESGSLEHTHTQGKVKDVRWRHDSVCFAVRGRRFYAQRCERN